jgi:hypothetical protein
LKGLTMAVICFMGYLSLKKDGAPLVPLNQQGLSPKTVGYRITPILAKTAVCDTNPHR